MIRKEIDSVRKRRRGTGLDRPKGILRVTRSRWSDEEFDPVATIFGSKNHQSLVFDWLVGLNRIGQDISQRTGLACRWELSKDGLSWTFHLRKGVLFDKDYGEVTAEDVKFSIGRTLFTKGTLAGFAESLKSAIQEIQVMDTHVVRFVLKAPRATLPYDLSRMGGIEGIIYSKKQVETVGEGQFGANPAGSGPYRLLQWDRGQFHRFEAKEDYWQFTPRFKEIYNYRILNEATRLTMAKTGVLDVCEISELRLGDLEAAGFNIFEKRGANPIAVYMHNQWEGYAADARIRLALNLAINKPELNQTVLKGRGEMSPGGGFVTWAFGGRRFDPHPYDPQRAKELLAEAGYRDGFELEMIPIPWEPLVQVGEAVARYLDAIGVKCRIIVMDMAERAARRRNFDTKNALAPQGIANRVFPHGFYRHSFHSKGVYAETHDPKLDVLVEAVETSRTLDEYARCQGQIQQYIHENANIIPLMQLSESYAVNPRLAVGDWRIGGRSPAEMGLYELARG